MTTRKRFQRWWESQCHPTGRTQYDVLIDFIDDITVRAHIREEDFQEYLDSLPSEKSEEVDKCPNCSRKNRDFVHTCDGDKNLKEVHGCPVCDDRCGACDEICDQ